MDTFPKTTTPFLAVSVYPGSAQPSADLPETTDLMTLGAELAQWAAVNHAQGVKALYRT